MTAAIAAFFMLTTVAAICAAWYAQDRCRNLECLLDDARRNAAYWQERTDKLIEENNTLLTEFTRREERNQYLESCFCHRKATLAGYRLLSGQPAPLHLYVAEAHWMP